MTLPEFNELALHDENVDRALDERQLELLRRDGVILEGRMAGWIAATHDIPAFKIWLVADEDERIRRLVARDGGDVEAQRKTTQARVEQEAERYRRFYGADPSDQGIYDLVLDSTAATPAELVARVVKALPAPG
jgi:cytidylate kinase